jgi:hypothetical protein
MSCEGHTPEARLAFTVTQTGHIVTVASAALNFAGMKNAGTLNPITPPQSVTVAFDAVGTSTWSASANQPWVQLTSASGTGAGSFTVGIINPGGILPPNVLSGQATLNATIMLTSTNVSNSPKTIPVTLRLGTAGLQHAAGRAAARYQRPARHRAPRLLRGHRFIDDRFRLTA